MSVSFKELDLNLNHDVKTFSFQNKEIEVKQHISVVDKNDLIQIALQKSYENGIYNDILTDAYFHLNIVYLYTNIEFVPEDKEDELALYDKLYQSNLLNSVLACMDPDEYNNLVEIMNGEIQKRMQYNNSAAAVLQSIIQDLPANAAAAADIVNNWDPQKFQSVQDMVNLARQTGMNPSIPERQIETESAHEDNLINFLEEQNKITE